MARLTPLPDVNERVLDRLFGFEVAAIEALDLGSVNSNFRLRTSDGRTWFARIYEEQGVEGAVAELRLLRELAARGVPMALPRPLVDGRDVAVWNGKALSVYEWIDGEHACNARVTEARAHALGRALASVHLATPSLSAVPEGRFGIAGIRTRLDAIAADTRAFDDAVGQLRGKLEHYAAVRDATLPSGLIHGDLFRDNVLWQGDRLVALLDFESASQGPFVYDIAVCLLAWCYTDALRVPLGRALVRGYESERALTQAERNGLSGEAALACVRFATTRIRDFSMRAAPGQAPARDYRRFLQRLADVEAGALDALFVA